MTNRHQKNSEAVDRGYFTDNDVVQVQVLPEAERSL
jgi:hypothetical protein